MMVLVWHLDHNNMGQKKQPGEGKEPTLTRLNVCIFFYECLYLFGFMFAFASMNIGICLD